MVCLKAWSDDCSCGYSYYLTISSSLCLQCSEVLCHMKPISSIFRNSFAERWQLLSRWYAQRSKITERCSLPSKTIAVQKSAQLHAVGAFFCYVQLTEATITRDAVATSAARVDFKTAVWSLSRYKGFIPSRPMYTSANICDTLILNALWSISSMFSLYLTFHFVWPSRTWMAPCVYNGIDRGVHWCLTFSFIGLKVAVELKCKEKL